MKSPYKRRYHDVCANPFNSPSTVHYFFGISWLWYNMNSSCPMCYFNRSHLHTHHFKLTPGSNHPAMTGAAWNTPSRSKFRSRSVNTEGLTWELKVVHWSSWRATRIVIMASQRARSLQRVVGINRVVVVTLDLRKCKDLVYGAA